MSKIIYRIPYQGSKQSIVKKIFNIINNDIGNTNDLFETNKINKIYDLFCGGGAIGYYFYNQGWQVYMNDIQKPLIDLHKILQIKENSPLTKELLYKWIDKEDFDILKNRQDWYGELIRLCWSFGNDGRSYLFGKDIVEYKKQLHFVVVNKSIEAGHKFLKIIGKESDFENFSKIYDIKEQKDRRLFIRTYIINNIKLNENSRKVIELQQLERLEQLKQLEQKITFYNKNFYDIEIKPNSIIYCDPPYQGTKGYNKIDFDFNKFDNWIREKKNQGIKVYISEYTNHNSEWREVASIDKMSLFNNSKDTKIIKQEKIFCNI